MKIFLIFHFRLDQRSTKQPKSAPVSSPSSSQVSTKPSAPPPNTPRSKDGTISCERMELISRDRVQSTLRCCWNNFSPFILFHFYSSSTYSISCFSRLRKSSTRTLTSTSAVETSRPTNRSIPIQSLLRSSLSQKALRLQRKTQTFLTPLIGEQVYSHIF